MATKNNFMKTRVAPIQIRNHDNDEQNRKRYQRQEAGLYGCFSCCSWVSILVVITILAITGTVICLVLVIILKMPATASTSTSDSNTTATSLNSTNISTTTVGAINSTTIGTISIGTTTSSTTTTTAVPYCLTRVTFDDIPNPSSMSGVVPNGYNNLNWTNAEYVNSSAMPLSGYQTVAFNSTPYVAYSPSAAILTVISANGTTFSFDSVVVASAWRDNLNWTIQTYRGASLYISGSFNMSTINRTTISCTVCTGLTRISFTTSSGTPRSGLAENGTQFAMDDLCISFGY